MNSYDGHAQQLPDVADLNPVMMTASELQQKLEQLFGWLQREDEKPDGSDFSDEQVQQVRDAANMLLQERRDRHADESAPRGG